MGGDKLLDQIFNLKFTSKQLCKSSSKCEKEEKTEKLKVPCHPHQPRRLAVGAQWHAVERLTDASHTRKPCMASFPCRACLGVLDGNPAECSGSVCHKRHRRVACPSSLLHAGFASALCPPGQAVLNSSSSSIMSMHACMIDSGSAALAFVAAPAAQVKRAIEKGNIDGAKIYAQNAIRKKTEALNYLRLASRLDAVVSRLDTQAKMNMINSSMSQARALAASGLAPDYCSFSPSLMTLGAPPDTRDGPAPSGSASQCLADTPQVEALASRLNGLHVLPSRASPAAPVPVTGLLLAHHLAPAGNLHPQLGQCVA